MRKSTVIALAASSLTGALLLVAACNNEGGGLFDRWLSKKEKGIAVTVESVAVEERSQGFKVPATIEAAETAEISIPEDVTIERINVAEGDTVNAGDIVVRISEQETQARLAKMRTELRDAQTALERSQYALRNKDRLFQEGRMDRTQYDNVETDVANSEAAVERVQTNIARFEEKAGNPAIPSPVGGTVARINAAPGLMVPAGKPILVIAKNDPLTLAFRLAANQVAGLKVGAPVAIRIGAPGGDNVQGRILSIATEPDPRDNLQLIKAQLPNPGGRFKANMRAEAEFTGATKDRVFVIPEEALIRDRQAFFVYTVDKGVAHRVQVIPSDTRGTRVDILRGLNEDDLVVVRGHQQLAEGTVVDIWKR